MIRPYVHGEVGFGFMKNKVEYYEGNIVQDNVGVLTYEIGGGMSIFVSQKVALDIGLSFDYLSVKENENNQTNYRNSTSDFNYGVGVIVLL